MLNSSLLWTNILANDLIILDRTIIKKFNNSFFSFLWTGIMESQHLALIIQLCVFSIVFYVLPFSVSSQRIIIFGLKLALCYVYSRRS